MLLADQELGRPHLIEEDEGGQPSASAPPAMRAHLEAAKITGPRYDDMLDGVTRQGIPRLGVLGG